MDFALTVPLALAALGFEAVAGYPDAVYRLIGHPVTWIGWLIGWLDRVLNRETDDEATRRAAGVAALLLILAAAIAGAAGVAALLPENIAGRFVLACLASTLVAQASLGRHVRAVADALDSGGLAAGRAAVAHIVGRDPAALDAAGVARAAIESLAENFSDGVVAPALWIALFGLPGGTAYKAANTADSMIGHRTRRHAAFGFAAARFDDLVNLPASRLSALWLVLAAAILPHARSGDAWRAAWRDAPRHRSPNAGWPEAAMAGALGLRLAGARVYGGVRVEDAEMGAGRREAGSADIRRALALYRIACVLQMLAYAVLTFVLIAPG